MYSYVCKITARKLKVKASTRQFYTKLRKYITYRNAATGGPSHARRQRVQRIR